MKNVLLVFLGAVSFALGGCVSTKNAGITGDRLSQLSGATIATSSRPRPDFASFKAGNAMFGLVGGIAAVASGNSMIQEFDVQDPAIPLAQDLIQHLVTSFHVVPQPDVAVSINTADVLKISEAVAGKSDLVLDVQTVNWSLFYLPTKWLRYRLIYSVKLRLIDVRKKELIAEGFYAWQTPNESVFPTSSSPRMPLCCARI